MKLYVYRPKGFGQETFFVTEESKEKALEKIQEFIIKENCEPWDWNRYQWEEYDIGKVAINFNA